uniref:Smr domain-containing protein n=1 Tax=Pinguiococcus pyrenoidosus TaxID=172671 RepID=A0A7R9YA53_9STRA
MALKSASVQRGPEAAFELYQKRIEARDLRRYDNFLASAALKVLADCRSRQSKRGSAAGNRSRRRVTDQEMRRAARDILFRCIEPDVVTLTSYIRVLQGDQEADSVFTRLKNGEFEGVTPNGFTYATYMIGLVKRGEAESVLDLLHQDVLGKFSGREVIGCYDAAFRAMANMPEISCGETLALYERLSREEATLGPTVLSALFAALVSKGEEGIDIALELLREQELSDRVKRNLLEAMLFELSEKAAAGLDVVASVDRVLQALDGGTTTLKMMNIAAAAFAASRRPEKALSLFAASDSEGDGSDPWYAGFEARGLRPNRYSATIAMRAAMSLDAASKDDLTLRIFLSLRDLGIAPDAVLQCVLLDRFSMEPATPAAKHLLEELQQKEPNREVSNMIIQALYRWNELEEALTELYRGARGGAYPALQVDSEERTLDLHGLNPEAVKTLVSGLLLDFLKLGRPDEAGDEEDEDGPTRSFLWLLGGDGDALLQSDGWDLVFITGRGKHSRYRVEEGGRVGQLRRAVLEGLSGFPGGGIHLSEAGESWCIGQKPRAVSVPAVQSEQNTGNEGRVSVPGAAIREWVRMTRLRRLHVLSTVVPHVSRQLPLPAALKNRLKRPKR